MVRAGRSTVLVEAEDEVGGAARSLALTLPGFVHDIGAAITPLAIASPFMRTVPLEQFGIEWVYPPLPVAHPIEGSRSAYLDQSLQKTAAGLGVDAKRYLQLIRPLVADWEKLAPAILGPPRPRRHPLALGRFGVMATWPSTWMIRSMFEGENARALMAGFAAHSVLPLDAMGTSAFVFLFAVTGHTTGWPFPRGGMQTLSNGLARYFESLGGEIVTGTRIKSLAELPSAKSVLLDLSPTQIDEIAGNALPDGYRSRLRRYRHGPGVFKLDYALSGLVPWTAPEAALAGTVQVGGTLSEVAGSEQLVARGGHPERPFVLVAQQSRFDSSRAPDGKHTLWAYCHVPNGSSFDMTDRIEAQIERFAPGFRDVVLSRHILAPADLQRMDANLIGGDIAGGAQSLWRILFRPVMSLNPYVTPKPGLYICSASTPPGGGVHGMCGYWAARAALKRDGI